LDEIDKNKLVFTACPHNDRSDIARIYLTMKGYRVKYLTDGLLGWPNCCGAIKPEV